jgi:arsenate reductase
MARKPNVLFVCSHNSARSQMAQGWLGRLAGERFEAHSAGVEPGQVHPLTVRVMNEVGIDLSDARAKGIGDYLGKVHVSHLIVVCDQAAKTCPRIWPGLGERTSWSFDDPSAAQGSEEEKLVVFRRVRDQIKAKLEAWLAALPTEGA